MALAVRILVQLAADETRLQRVPLDLEFWTTQTVSLFCQSLLKKKKKSQTTHVTDSHGISRDMV